LNEDKRFQTLKQQCTPESEQLAHQNLLAFAFSFLIEFLDDLCGLTVRDTSAKDYPMDPRRRIDLTFVVERSKDGQVQWPDVVFGLVIKPEELDSHLEEAHQQLCDFVSQLFYTDVRRTFVPAFAMTATKLRYYEFTRTVSDDLGSYNVICSDELSFLEGQNVSLGFCCVLHTLINTPARLGYSILRTRYVVEAISAWLGSLPRPKPNFTIEPINGPSRAGKPCLLKLCVPNSWHISANVVAKQATQIPLDEFNLLAPYPYSFTKSEVCVFDIVNQASIFVTFHLIPAHCDQSVSLSY
jgi:hypothetical protein